MAASIWAFITGDSKRVLSVQLHSWATLSILGRGLEICIV